MKKIGIIGSGQLGRMTIEEARKLLCHIEVLSPEYPAPAAELADEVQWYERERVERIAAEMPPIAERAAEQYAGWKPAGARIAHDSGAPTVKRIDLDGNEHETYLAENERDETQTSFPL